MGNGSALWTVNAGKSSCCRFVPVFLLLYYLLIIHNPLLAKAHVNAWQLFLYKFSISKIKSFTGSK
jgi:hypothetical protein